MNGITNNTIGWIFIGAWLALGAKLLLNRYRRRAGEKQKAERRATFKARRDERDDKRPTMVEALESELEAYHSITVRGDDEPQRNNALYARIVMEDDLGRYAEGPRPFADLDQAHRDILLAHARKDAAEALANSRTLLLEVRKLTGALDEISRALFWLVAAYLLWSWWKSGFALWWQ